MSPTGILFAGLGVVALLLPYMTVAANRIVAGDAIGVTALADNNVTLPGIAAILVGLGLGLLRSWPSLRVTGAIIGLAGTLWLLIQAAPVLLDGAGEFARVSPAVGFWCLLAILSMLMADALAQMSPRPLARVALLMAVLAVLGLVFWSGALSELSVLQEFASRKAAFVNATRRHLGLAFGSLATAVAIGFPLGILCHGNTNLRRATLPVLSFLQTIPSLAMFGLMIPILGWVGNTVPGAQAIGIAGIGFAPALLALILYALLPVVGNTVAGLESAPPAALEAARGMGMTPRQRLLRVQLPLGLPIILTGLRIVLVQNIGLAVIAGLIGGGGYGTFVFQGLNQTATDLILLGALPTVTLALVSAILMDVLVDLTEPTPKGTS